MIYLEEKINQLIEAVALALAEQRERLEGELATARQHHDELASILIAAGVQPQRIERTIINPRIESLEAQVRELKATVHEWEITVPGSTIIGLNNELGQVKQERDRLMQLLAKAEGAIAHLEDAHSDYSQLAVRNEINRVTVDSPAPPEST